MNSYVWMALAATLGTWFVTALGAAVVLFFRSPSPKVLNALLGFAAGVMIAASFWSLLEPAIDRAEAGSRLPAWCVVTLGFLLGAGFLWGSDKLVSRAGEPGRRGKRSFLLVLAITLHNIPEGLAVGVAFGALRNSPHSQSALLAAVAVAVGIGLQNFPEGAAVSLPLYREGYSRGKSFLVGQASALVEPVAGFWGALLVQRMQTVLPYALSFAAGAMILVAVHELIPECQRLKAQSPYTATVGIVLGFAVMMLLDVMLG